MRRSISYFLGPLAVLIAVTQQLACYKPNIVDGGLRCKADAGTRSCPEGFKCDTATQLCWKHLDGGIDRKPDGPTNVDGRDGPDLPDGPAGSDADAPCFEAKPGCTPDNGACDPYCQM